MNNSDPAKASDASRRSQLRGLIAIIVAMVLGAVVGAFYGRQMWLAGGGPAEEIVRLEATAKQKAERAAALDATDPQEAARLRGHIPKIDARLDEVGKLQQQVAAGGVSTIASFAWEFTKFCGELFLQALRLMVIPLVVTSMVCGITSLGDIRHVGRVGGMTVLYFLATTLVAVLIGIMLVEMIRPGVGADDTFAYVSESVRRQRAYDRGRHALRRRSRSP